MRVRSFSRGALLLGALACSEDKPTAPPPPFPAVSGTYRVDAIFSSFPPSIANATGTITFAQPTRESGTLNATASITVAIAGSTSQITTVRSASVTESGAIRLQLVPANTSSTWGFDGQLNASGATITGTHTLVGTTGSNAGTWTATRQ